MIFVDKIDNAIQIAKYLQSRLLKRIWNERDLEYIISTFLANLTTTSRFKFLVSLLLSNTRIRIYIGCADIGINLFDICRYIQFEISNYITLPKLPLRLGYKGRDTSHLAVVMIFV